MKDYPLVSIVTPSYNQAGFLEKTIRSVLEQDYPAIEYAVVDGGSTDGSVDIIKKYASRLAWWVSEKDSGQAAAINKGFARATGKYIAWVNSDDYYYPGAIASAIQALEADENLGFVYGNVMVVDQRTQPLNLLRYQNWGINDLLSFHIIGQPGVFMRRSVLEKAGYLEPDFHYMLDHHLWLRMARLAPIHYVNETWAGAHYHEGCKNKALGPEFGKEAWRIVEWVKHEPEFQALYERSADSIQAGAYRINGFYLLDAELYREAFKAYWAGYRLDSRIIRPEWYRMVFAFFGFPGLEKLRRAYLKCRRRGLKSQPSPQD